MREVLIRVYSRLFVVMENGGLLSTANGHKWTQMDTNKEVLVSVYSRLFVVVRVHPRSVS